MEFQTDLIELVQESTEDWHQIFREQMLLEHGAVMAGDHVVLTEASTEFYSRLQKWGDDFFRLAETVLMRAWEKVIDETEKDKEWVDANLSALRSNKMEGKTLNSKNYESVLKGQSLEVVKKMIDTVESFPRLATRTVYEWEGDGNITARIKAEFVQELGGRMDSSIEFMQTAKTTVLGEIMEDEIPLPVYMKMVRDVPEMIRIGIKFNSLSRALRDIRTTFESNLRDLQGPEASKNLADGFRAQAQVSVTTLSLATAVYNQSRNQVVSILKKSVGGGAKPGKENGAEERPARESFSFIA